MIDLFHLHGFIKEFDSLVFTSQQYATAYMADAAFGKNLQELFKSDRTVLFIGYGVAEFELIRYFLRASNDGRENLFMLSGYLKKDDIKREFDEEYFGSLGIRVLPYSIESKDYAALKDVLKEWDKVVRNKTVAHLKPTVQMKEAFKAKPTTKSLLKIKNYLK